MRPAHRGGRNFKAGNLQTSEESAVTGTLAEAAASEKSAVAGTLAEAAASEKSAVAGILAEAAASEEGSVAGTFDEEHIRWNCRVCGEWHADSEGRCVACQADRPLPLGRRTQAAFDDGESGVSANGLNLGPDGLPREVAPGMDDRTLRIGREEHIRGIERSFFVHACPLVAAFQFGEGNDGKFFSFLADSGAGVNVVTPELAEACGLPIEKSLKVIGVDNKELEVRGGGPVWASVVCANGKRERVKIAERAFTSPEIRTNLLSLGELLATPGGDVSLKHLGGHLDFSGGYRVNLTPDGQNTWWLGVQILREPSAASQFLPALVCPVRLNPEAVAGRQRPVMPSGFAAEDDFELEEGNDEQVAVPEKLQRAYRNYVYYHGVLNHRSGVLDLFIRSKLIRNARKPPFWRCWACEMNARKHPFSSDAREVQVPLSALVPFAEVEADVFGPLRFKNRNNFSYLVGFICTATGAVFVQPVSAKSQAVDVLKYFHGHVGGISRFVEAAFGYPAGFIKIHCLRTDRGGEFTTTWGATESAFDEACRLLAITRKFNTAGEPRTGTTRIERLWGTLKLAADAYMESSGRESDFIFDAYMFAAYVHNRIPTQANVLGKGEAPYATLGLKFDLSTLVPFNNLCIIKCSANAKGELTSKRGWIIGYATDGPGYRVLVQDDKVRDSTKLKIETSVHVTPRRNGLAWRLLADGTAVSEVDYLNVPDGSLGKSVDETVVEEADGAADSDSDIGEGSLPPAVQTVGAAPGDAGSRAALQHQPSGVPHKRKGKEVTLTTAQNMIRDAISKSLRIQFDQENRKAGLSFDRYEIYKSATSFQELAALMKVPIKNASDQDAPVFKGPLEGLSGDLVNDVSRGMAWFLRPDETSSPADPQLARILAKSSVAAAESQRSSGMLGPEVPREIVVAAFAATMAGTNQGGRDVPQRLSNLGSKALPLRMNEWSKHPNFDSHILPALKKELAGFHNVWDEVPQTPDMRVIPSMLLISQKDDGRVKVRLVALGNRTIGGGVHYDEVVTSMVSLTALKMIISFSAGNNDKLFSIDFTQAFLNAPVGHPNLYLQLPELPYQLRNGEFGRGRGAGYVGHLKRAVYGLCDAPRCWQRHLLVFLKTGVGVEINPQERSVFRWSWEGECLIGCIHVDDILYSGGPVIRAEFVRRIREKFEITGGDEPCEKFCGVQFAYDPRRSTITVHQKDFILAMLEKYDSLDVKPADTPMRVGAPPLKPNEGETVDPGVFDYMMFLGDLTWVTRTNPSLVFVAHELSRFIRNPGAEHVLAAQRVLAYLRGVVDVGLTFHGSTTVLDKPYPHKHVLIAACDSNFPHDGRKAISGITIHMNGAAIVHVSRTQSHVSYQTTEAEVKGASLLVWSLKSVLSLWSGVMGIKHPSVRVMIDNKGAKHQVECGADSASSAPYARCRSYVEDAIYSGLLWMDLVPGEENPADMATKQVRSTAEFQKKNGILCGSEPDLYVSAEIARMLRAKK